MIIVNSRFLTQPITGVQRFAIEISKQLKELYGDKILFVSPSNIVHKELANQLDAVMIGINHGHLWEQIDLSIYLLKNNSPLLINLCSTAPVFYIKKIVTHHDITYVKYPDSFSLKFRLLYKLLIPNILRNSLKIITVSKFSKVEICNHYNIQENKIEIISNAASANFRQINPFKVSVGKPFILAVSSANYHKNFHSLIQAFLELTDNKSFDLKIIGELNKPSFSNQKMLEQLMKQKNVHFLGRLSDEQLVQAYQNATVFAFPSFYEGFGIPPIEAQACGCPVIASHTSCMPEILRDSVLYFDPENINSIKEAIEKILYNVRLREELISKGLKNASRFSWEESGEALMNVIDKINLQKKRINGKN